MSPPRGQGRRGTAYGFTAYGLWGLFPLYFHALKPAGAWEILAHRILWTFLLCLLWLGIRRDLAWLRALARRPRVAVGLALAAGLIAVNWVIYVLAVLSGGPMRLRSAISSTRSSPSPSGCSCCARSCGRGNGSRSASARSPRST